MYKIAIVGAGEMSAYERVIKSTDSRIVIVDDVQDVKQRMVMEIPFIRPDLPEYKSPKGQHNHTFTTSSNEYKKRKHG